MLCSQFTNTQESSKKQTNTKHIYIGKQKHGTDGSFSSVMNVIYLFQTCLANFDSSGCVWCNNLWERIWERSKSIQFARRQSQGIIYHNIVSDANVSTSQFKYIPTTNKANRFGFWFDFNRIGLNQTLNDNNPSPLDRNANEQW